MVKPGWSSISLPSELMEGLDKFLSTADAEKIGLKSRSQIISLLIRRFLEKGIVMISDSHESSNAEIKKLEKEFDKKLDDVMEYIPNIMIQLAPMFKDGATEKEVFQALSFFEKANPPFSQVFMKELEKIQKKKSKQTPKKKKL